MGKPIEQSTDQSTKFTREFLDYNGAKSIWTYDYSITRNGPVNVEIIYSKDYTSFEEEQKDLPITKRKYLNKETGKYVAYTRAKQLGIL